MALETIGLEAVFNTKEFQAGMKIYQAGLNAISAQTQAAAGSAGGAAAGGGAGGGIPTNLSGIGGMIGGLTGPQGALVGAAIGSLATQLVGGLTSMLGKVGDVIKNIFTGALSAVKAFTDKLTALGKESIMEAGRFEELSLTAQVMGQRMGYTEQVISDSIQGVRDYGIEASVAADLVSQFTRYQLDLADSTRLARVAQDAAVISGANSSETLDRMVRGIILGSGEMLRYAGITMNTQMATEKYAQSIGKSVEQLTSAEKTQAMLNGVLEEGARLAGIYEAAMTNPYKLLQSFPRVTNDLMVALGEPFQQAFYNVVRTGYEIVKSFTAIISKGGQLYPLLRTIGAVASVVTGFFRDLLITTVQVPAVFDELGNEVEAASTKFKPSEWLTGFLDFASQTIITLADLAVKVFSWGVKIASELGAGIIQGASQVIVGAMNFIAGILTSWLSPGSPPAVAPEIDKWGAQAMGQWLKGFTQADFGILSSIQSPLKSVLGEVFGKDAAGANSAYVEISRQLIGALNDIRKTGSYDAGVLNSLASSAGQYGDSIRELVRLQLEQAKNQQAVTDAGEAYQKAVDEENAGYQKLIKLQTEYNDLMAGGASDSTLAAKAEEIGLALDGVKLSGVQKSAAIQNYELAAKQTDTLKEQVSLQNSLVSAMLGLSNAQTVLLTGMGGGGGGGGGGFLSDMLGLGDGSFQTTIDTALETLKTNVTAKMTELFKPVVDAWNTDVLPAVENIKLAWENLGIAWDTFWTDDRKESFALFIQNVQAAFGNDVYKDIGYFAGALLAAGLMAGAVALLFLVLGAVLLGLPFFAVLAGLIIFRDQIVDIMRSIYLTFVDWENGIIAALNNVVNALRTVVWQFEQAWLAASGKAYDTRMPVWEDYFDLITPIDFTDYSNYQGGQSADKGGGYKPPSNTGGGNINVNVYGQNGVDAAEIFRLQQQAILLSTYKVSEE